MSLIEELGATDKKGLFKSDNNTVSYETGITVLDYANGFWSDAIDEDGNKIQVPNIGIPAGSMTSVIGNTGIGKALPDSAPIPTPKGFTRMGLLEVGDIIFDRFGNTTKVLGVFPQGNKPAYRITFEDGRTAISCNEHLWTVFNEVTGKLEVKSLEKIMHSHQYANGFVRIPMAGAVDYESEDITFSPYALGVFLAKGIWTKENPIVYDVPEEIIDHIKRETGWKSRKTVVKSTKDNDESSFENGLIYYTFKNGFKKIPISRICDQVDGLWPLLNGDRNSARISNRYAFATTASRRQLLAGYCDAKATFIPESVYNVEFTESCYSIASALQSIARSLGYRAKLTKEEDICRVQLGIPTFDLSLIFRFGTLEYIVKHYISSIKTDPFYLDWKYLSILKIENLHREVPMTCIKVDSPLELFQCYDHVVTHNTTLAIQIGWNIVKNFEDGLLIIKDCEKTGSRQRIVNLTHSSLDEPRIILDKTHTSIEDTLDTFNRICELKEANGKKFMYEVKGKSFDGKPFFMYVPSVIIIDSLPSFNSKEFNTDDLGNQIDQMKASKDITRFYTNVLDKAWKYNIIFIVINHIRQNPNMNPYAQPPQGLLMINPMTETLPRGNVPQYFSSTYFRVKSKKSAAYTIDDDGFEGYKCEIQLAKSKTNSVGTSFPVTFNTQTGFDPVYSLYEFAKATGLVQGKNPYLYFAGHEEMKFNRKEFNSKMYADPEFYALVTSTLKPYYEALLGSKKIMDSDADDVNVATIEFGDIKL